MAEKPEDFNMPANVVARIIKDALPNGISVSPDVRSASSRCASIFILYVTTSANNIALSNKRKTLTPQDIIEALEQIGFEEFSQKLTQFHREMKKERVIKQMSKKLSQKSSNQSINSKNSNNSDDNQEVDDEEEEEYMSDAEED